MSNERTHFVKVREKGKTRWAFLTPQGRSTSLRIHASQMSEEQAKRVAVEIETENPAYEAKTVHIDDKGGRS